MTFGERLKSLREDNDERQRDIADILFVSPNMISAYELGKHFPKNEKSLIALANHFDVSLDYLLGYSNIPKYDNNNIINVSGLNDEEINVILQMIYTLRKKKKNLT